MKKQNPATKGFIQSTRLCRVDYHDDLDHHSCGLGIYGQLQTEC